MVLEFDIIEDNYVAYEIHQWKSDAEVVSVDDILKHLEPYLREYFWHKEGFNLKKTGDAHCGKIYFGDCLDDEWFTAYLLLLCSGKFPQLAFKIWDNDGQFLLIEAAEHIPKWLEPDTADNRVFIVNGEFLIIPRDGIPISENVIPIEESLQYISQYKPACVANKEVQQCIHNKLSIYPAVLKEHILKAKVIVPRDVARILEECPQALSVAVEAFYTRDSLSIKSCQKMANYPPSSSVVTCITLTRPLYAQLMCQKFNAPRPFLMVEDLKAIINKPFKFHNEYKWFEMGMKIACGFEILMSDSMYKGNKKFKNSSSNDELNTFYGYGGRKCSNELFSKPRDEIKRYLNESTTGIPDDSAFDGLLERKGYWSDKYNAVDDTWMNLDVELFERLLREKSGARNKDVEDFLEEETGFEGVGREDSGSEYSEFSEEDEDFGSSSEEEGFRETRPLEKIEAFLNRLKSLRDETIDYVTESDESGSDLEDNTYKAMIEAMEYELRKSSVFDEEELKIKEISEEEEKALLLEQNMQQNFKKSISDQGTSTGPTATLIESLNYKNKKKKT